MLRRSKILTHPLYLRAEIFQEKNRKTSNSGVLLLFNADYCNDRCYLGRNLFWKELAKILYYKVFEL